MTAIRRKLTKCTTPEAARFVDKHAKCTKCTPLHPHPASAIAAHCRLHSTQPDTASLPSAMPDETSPLLPAPTDTRTPGGQRRRWRQYALYALLVAAGVGAGVGLTLAVHNHRTDDHGPMVPPIFSLPPVCIVCCWAG